MGTVRASGMRWFTDSPFRLAPSLLAPSLLAATLQALTLVALPSPARADAVDPCPPGFQPSHSGCHFGPTTDDFLLCGGCSCVIVGLGAVSALLVFARTRASGPREGGGHG
jgi:hypothetical protein